MAAAEVSRGTGARHVHHHTHCENNCRNFTPDENSGGGGGGESGGRTHYHHHPPHHPSTRSENHHNDNHNVGQRLYSQGHICNHARCAANDPHYNVKAATPPKKFLVAKSKLNAYGGLEDRTGRGGARKKSSGSGGGSGGDGSSCTSSDHDHQSHALHSLTNSVLLENTNSKGGNGGGERRPKPKPKPELPFSKGRQVPYKATMNQINLIVSWFGLFFYLCFIPQVSTWRSRNGRRE